MTQTETEPDVLDEEWLAAPSRRSRARVGLLLLLAVLLVFLGGVEVQKRWGSDSTSGTGAVPSGAFRGAPTTSGSGTFGSPPTGASDSSDSSGAASTSSTTPAVIGKVTGIHGRTWTVQDLGGKDHTVTVTAETTLTRPLARATGPIRPGSSVTVLGTTHGKAVTATAITIR
ncbi:MAG: hypothetical protein QM747_21990 [Nocardioides sp.]